LRAKVQYRELDLLREPSRLPELIGLLRPAGVINAAAMTDVDACEQRPDDARTLNAAIVELAATAAARCGARFTSLSTDYVFDGEKATPWVESDPTGPRTAYGRTKLAGEEQIAEACPEHAIVRTAWLFGVRGPNFVDTMLKLAAERDELSVVDDQVGCPTWAGHLAPALVDMAGRRGDTGLFHGAGAGHCSWFEFAVAIFDRAGADVRVLPTTSEAFKRPAPRPAWSVMGTERAPGVQLPPWEAGLEGHLKERL
jgi:dTDP-4-dehydrorhamnose reductase